jgi:hypothetical protein
MNIKLKEISGASGFYLSDHHRLQSLMDIPAIYIWLLPGENGKSEFPIYVGETLYLRQRFLQHIESLVVGQYWWIDVETAEEFYEVVKQMQTNKEKKDWDVLLDQFSEQVEANYGKAKFQKMMDLE